MQNLVEKLSDMLKAGNIKLVTAESCTGGLLSAAMTHNPGASEVFERGFITYSNEAKHELLDVPQETLEKFGAVSAETAESMAKGALDNSHADISMSITGIAGPDGGTDAKPVGLVFLGYALTDGSSGTVQYYFDGTREEIQSTAAVTALKHLITLLEK